MTLVWVGAAAATAAELLDPLELQLAVPVLSGIADVSTPDVKSALAACGSGLFEAE
jgi:hypothetical protein